MKYGSLDRQHLLQYSKYEITVYDVIYLLGKEMTYSNDPFLAFEISEQALRGR